jgi:hypothetical protein
MEEFYVGSTIVLGSIIKEDGAVVDVSDATVKKILVKYPDGSSNETAADFTTDGTDGKIQISAFEVTQAGVHLYQPYIELDDFVGYGKPSSFLAIEL